VIRSKRRKLVHFLDQTYGQLFDLENDPQELVNLWDCPEARADREELLTVLREWRIRSQLHTAAWCEDWR
jgi:arylsulfatase A-like enzyme